MRSWRNHWPALGLLLILAFVAVVRIRLLSAPMERDEGEYAYAGQLMLEGVPPYQMVYNMKMPGTYAAYALSMAVFGQSVAGVRTGFLLANLAAVALIYFLARRFFAPSGALVASAAYALMSLSPHVSGPYMHATHFVVLAALGGILALWRAQERGRGAGFFWSGALFGAAFLMKQPGGAFAFFGAALLLWAAARRHPPGWKTHAARLGLYGAGVAAPIVLTCLALWRLGVWEKFWWWTVEYASVHATNLPWADGKLRLAGFFTPWYWDSAFWWLAAAGLAGALLEKNRADEKFLLGALLFFSAAAVVPTFNFTGHYFVMMLPVIALLCAKALTLLAGRLASSAAATVRCAPWMLFCLLWCVVASAYQNVFFLWSPVEVTANGYTDNNFDVYPVVGAFLNEHTASNATLAVLGSEPELLFYAHRHSVTGYIYMYDLMQEQPFRAQMEQEMRAEVERGKPDFIAFINLHISWLPLPASNLDSMEQWMKNYVESRYEAFGVVTFRPNLYIWGPDCLRHVRPARRFISIFKRKPGGINPKG